MSIMTVCQRCQLSLLGDAQHATFDECFIAMKERLGRISKLTTSAASSIAVCRGRKHRGRELVDKQLISRLDICFRCMTAGYSAYQGVRDITLGALEKMVKLP